MQCRTLNADAEENEQKKCTPRVNRGLPLQRSYFIQDGCTVQCFFFFLFVPIMTTRIDAPAKEQNGAARRLVYEEVHAMTTSNEGFNRAPLVKENCSFNIGKPSVCLQLLVSQSYTHSYFLRDVLRADCTCTY